MKQNYKKLIFIILLLLNIIFLTGCWDLKDINERLIVTALGFDYKDDEIWFYLEIANTENAISGEKRSVEGSSDKFITVKSHGKTLPQARDNLDEQLDKPIYLSGARTLMFTEQFANEYLLEYLYRFRADETYRKQSICVITKDDPEELFNKAHEEKESAGLYVEGEFETLDEMGKFFPRTASRIIENLSGDYSGLLLPCVGAVNNLPSVVGYSVLCGPKVIGFIPMEEDKIHGVYFMKVKKLEIVHLVPYKDMNFTVNVKTKKTKLEPSYAEEQIHMNLKLNISAEVMYGNEKTPYLFNDEDMKNMSAILGDIVKEDVTMAIEQAQDEFNCDYLQFDDAFRIKYPEVFDNMNWDEQFSKITTAVDVKVSMSTQPGLDYGPKASQ